MNPHRYRLERRKKHRCPACNDKRFVRYIDTETGDYLADGVGKCDRADRCGYHKPPREHLAESRPFIEPAYNPPPFNRESRPYRQAPKQAAAPQPQPSLAPLFDIFKASLQPGKTVEEVTAGNTFVKYLLTLFPADIVADLIARYYIGTSGSRWPGATVFWFISARGPQAGQVKLFDTTGHTASYNAADGEKKKCTTWMHSLLKHRYKKENPAQPLPNWLQAYDKKENKVSCLFGEHLLNLPENRGKPVALAEAPKTAIIASVYLPLFVWVAVGGLDWINADRCKALRGRSVTLYPDLSKEGTAYAKWSKKAKELSTLARLTVSDLLERNAGPEARLAGMDLADYLTRFNYEEFVDEPPPAPAEAQPAAPVQQHDFSKVITNTTDREIIQPVQAPERDFSHITTHTGESAPFIRPQPLRRHYPESWTAEIADLQTFFDSAILPTGPIKLDGCTTVADLAAFISSHLATVTANDGCPAFRPYLHRLQALRQRLSVYRCEDVNKC